MVKLGDEQITGDREIRVRALECAVRLCAWPLRTEDTKLSCGDILDAARDFEIYIRDGG